MLLVLTRILFRVLSPFSTGAAGAVAPSGMERFERRLQGFLAEEKGGVLVRSIALDALHLARTLKFAAAIGVRAQTMSPEELDGKRTAVGQLLAQTATELRELQVLLGQHRQLLRRIDALRDPQAPSPGPAPSQPHSDFSGLPRSDRPLQ